MAKKQEILDFQPIIKPLTVEEALYHIPWLDKDEDHINFIQVIFLFPGNIIFNIPTNDLLNNKDLTVILSSLKFFVSLTAYRITSKSL